MARAEAILTALKRSHPDDSEVRYRLALVLLRQRKLSEAESEMEASSKLAPGSPMVWLGLAQVRLQLGQREEALQAAALAAKQGRGDPSISRALVMLYEQAGDFARAAEEEARFSWAHPEDSQSPIRAMEFYLQAGQADASIEFGAKVLARGESGPMRGLLGRAYRLKKDPARAVEQFQLAIRLQPDQAAYYEELAALFLDHRTPEPAVAVLEAAAGRFSRNAEIRRQLGLALYAKGDSQRALEAFLQAIDLDPGSELMYVSLETLLPEAGARADDIAARLRRFAELKPASPVGHYLLAVLLSGGAGGAGAEAEALLRKSIAVSREFWPAYYELSKIFLAQERLAEAAGLLEKACALNPGHAASHYGLSQVYARLGNREQARKHREIHHRLSTADREAAEVRRSELPRLPYTIESR
jgi:tetratricopeptide (TPR) repeat protein